jgi:single-strand DNA-binding protein
MSSLNKVQLIGHFGSDPELRYTTDQTPVATFRMATSESYKDKSGTWHNKTEWHTILAWRHLAKRSAEKLKKGSLVYIEGALESREFETKDGEKHYTYKIVASEVKPFRMTKGHKDDAPAPLDEEEDA